jgi:5-methylcytosine-specific restriction endonuclease McrA
MDEALVHQVRQRVNDTCEYCQLPQACSVFTSEVDHIISRKHRGPTRLSNLACSCFYDNSFKGSDLTEIDPETGKITRLFHPRRHKWDRHFRWQGPFLVGRTAIGRTTIAVLRINMLLRVEHRAALMAAGLFPPA